MKKPFMFLSLIIPGPKSPKGNLDVFLQPLIEELKLLWEIGLPTYDISNKQSFQMKVALLWTVSDFPAYGILSGWTTAGKLACSYCMENTKAFTLKNGGKQSWFDYHRQFLSHNHVFRKNKSAFRKDTVENSSPPPRLSGEEVSNRVSLLPKTTECIRNEGKRPEWYGILHHWTKQSVFWELPYWRKLLIRHNLDVMHIEKNVFDNAFHTIMEVKGKTKDDLKARKDMKVYCKRRKLETRVVLDSKGGKKILNPNAPFMLPKEKRKLICEWVKKLKFPDGYASNLDLLPLNVWNVITELSQFFRDLCSTTLKVNHVVRLEENIPEIICKLERIFPPGFFNSMEHLPIHLPYEAKVGGPVQYRRMYPCESLFEEQMMRECGYQSLEEVWIKSEDEYPNWFKEYVLGKGINNDIIRSLSFGPLTRVRKFKQYHINGFHFHAFEYGKNKSTMKYGICVKRSQGKDFYGILQEVIELTYVGARKRYTTVLFKCDWFDIGHGTRIHEKYNLVEVNHIRRYPKLIERMVRSRGGLNGRIIIRPRTANPSRPISQSSQDENPDFALEVHNSSQNEEQSIEYNSNHHEEGRDADLDVDTSEIEEEAEFLHETGNPEATQILHKTEGLW
ncbi:uncharacterized protein LOC130589853 [Beta vulgaris subsp. vulgaris]|uniref:uncharacterized protein LOC130589853 n=1 Tax=Beta vulgaris subsp. vulgaris TaxID=3555 RepID=UPI00254664FB|nr:uncharacterized protein LOC130589853 [Beta vulgaris subsp. vulgaris]